MAVVGDSTSLGPTPDNLSLDDSLLMAQLKLRMGERSVLGELEECEAMSVIFLSLDHHHLTHHGHKLCQYVRSGRNLDALSEVVSVAGSREGSGVEAVVEALYAVGRHDLLHHRLGLTVDAALHKHFKTQSSLDPDRRALYCVFSGMAQEQADQLLHDSLSGWVSEEGRPLEETFVRNLTPTNYPRLLTQLCNALSLPHSALAAIITPHLHTSDPDSPTLPGPLDPSPPEPRCPAPQPDLYPPPSGYPHGLCLIFNVKTFIEPSAAHDQIPLNPRHGSEVDCARLSATFKLFGFHIMNYIDPDRHMLESIFLGLRTSAKVSLVSCLAICFMTHGDEYDNLYLHDRSCVGVTDLRKLCFTSALINKPRLFFIQACRGEQALRPILLQQDVCSVTHAESDCMISFATVEGYTAVRSQTEGSWYVSEVCNALQEFGHQVPVRTVLQRSRASLKARVDTMAGGYVTQLSEEKVTLTRDVQLVRAPDNEFVEGILELVQMEIQEQLIEKALEEAEEEEEEEEGQEGSEELMPHLAALHLS